jgi:hypothetical protein
VFSTIMYFLFLPLGGAVVGVQRHFAEVHPEPSGLHAGEFLRSKFCKIKREQLDFLFILKSITDLPDRTLAGEAS